MLFDTASPALDVTWIVQNISGGAIRFIGSCKGPAVELPAFPGELRTPRAGCLPGGFFVERPPPWPMTLPMCSEPQRPRLRGAWPGRSSTRS
jgi:hypothetical protein